MVITQSRSKRKVSGGRYISYRKKKQYESGSAAALTKLGAKRLKVVRTMGANKKDKLLSEEFANVVDPKTKKFQKVKIKTITGNPANRHFVRRNIITKGSIIDTELGKARVTSRPGQDGVVNAVFIEQK